MNILEDVLAGSADVSVILRALDSATGVPEASFDHATAGIDLWYRRDGAAKVSITEAALSALTDAHTDGGVEYIGDGYFRLDLPDAACASGARKVVVGGAATDIVIVGGTILLNGYDRTDTPATPADIRTEFDSNSTQLAAIVADTDELQTDWANGGRLDQILDARASQSSVDTIDDFLDTEVAAILAAVDTEVAAILAVLVNARSEPGQGAPAANEPLPVKIDYLYKWARNRRVNDGTDINYYADDATTIDHKQAVADNGSASSLGEMRTGA